MRQFPIYGLALLVFALGVWLTLEQGRKLQSSSPAVAIPTAPAAGAGGVAGVEPSASLLDNLRENLQDPLPRLFVQLILIILAARLCGAVAVMVRQPAVVGEIIAGILLGPSLLGWAWPGLFQFVFPANSLGSLRLLTTDERLARASALAEFIGQPR